jgi:hypothetical protein
MSMDYKPMYICMHAGRVVRQDCSTLVLLLAEACLILHVTSIYVCRTQLVHNYTRIISMFLAMVALRLVTNSHADIYAPVETTTDPPLLFCISVRD